MGIVWQAHDERLHRTVAIKQLLLQPGLTDAQAEEARRRCMREGRIAARLAHPNAITVYDVAEHEDDPWLVMEYLASKSLAMVLSERGTLAPQEAARIGTQIASALVAAHAAGIVHRDIKPANVLLSEDGTVKITDFGISRATGDVTVTATGMLAGTPAYLAPEVAKGQDPTPASDVFSLGSTLYTAIEGHSPFGLSENTLALLYAVAAGNITPPRHAGPLTALLMQLLRVDPNERPSLTAARENLVAVADGRSAPAVMDAASAPTNRIAGNRRPQPPLGPPTPPRPSQPPQWAGPPKDATRLDVHPFSEPTPSPAGTVMHREPMPSGPQLAHHPPGPPRRPPRPARSDGRGRSVALTVLAIVAAMAVGILVATLVSSAQKDNGGANQNSQTQPPSEDAGPTPEDYQQAIRDYYALLPDNTDEAYDLLTGQALEKSGGREQYEQFWNTIESVEVQSTEAEGTRVAADLFYQSKNGDTSLEATSFALVEEGDKLLIENFVVVGSG
ncbi:MAG: serine/threonine-protein kinase [Actinophytocola sp.]|uniref:serine/threonine-protein kinase n=1 Tax=Actinophytocola sp. TaxID=1872138 RepID=UPI003D6A2857